MRYSILPVIASMQSFASDKAQTDMLIYCVETEMFVLPSLKNSSSSFRLDENYPCTVIF